MIDTAGLVISLGWCWRCLACGEHDGSFIDREHCEAAAINHHNECEGPS